MSTTKIVTIPRQLGHVYLALVTNIEPAWDDEQECRDLAQLICFKGQGTTNDLTVKWECSEKTATITFYRP